jgi:hypothetical protein
MPSAEFNRLLALSTDTSKTNESLLEEIENKFLPNLGLKANVWLEYDYGMVVKAKVENTLILKSAVCRITDHPNFNCISAEGDAIILTFRMRGK